LPPTFFSKGVHMKRIGISVAAGLAPIAVIATALISPTAPLFIVLGGGFFGLCFVLGRSVYELLED
jgi:hypothetical protein